MLRALYTSLIFALLCNAPGTYSQPKPTVQQAREYTFSVIERKPLARALYTQGLEIHDGDLFLSSGGYNQSQLLRYDFASGQLKGRRHMDGRLFAEGLTIFNGKIYQLTWRRRLGLVYDLKTMQPEARWRLRGEGWGLTNNGRELIYSDGSDQLHFISPADGSHLRSIRVTLNGQRIRNLNELEWIDGQIWANVWQTDRILLIDPTSGVATASVDLGGLLPLPERKADTDVLNGIARDPATGQVWVTGKRWPWLYRIELRPTKDGPPGEDEPTHSTNSR
ncbi:MAG: glutaminyl-peptide cyclotransferase [Halioglobus sp.]